jgi:hypothetical protein
MDSHKAHSHSGCTGGSLGSSMSVVLRGMIGMDMEEEVEPEKMQFNVRAIISWGHYLMADGKGS